MQQNLSSPFKKLLELKVFRNVLGFFKKLLLLHNSFVVGFWVFFLVA